MAENTKIEWDDDSVSFWWGCTRFGEGCRFCYAEILSKRFGDFWGPTAPRLRIDGAAKTIRRLNRKAEREGEPRIVFVNSMSDFFEEHNGPVVTRAGHRLYRFEGGLHEASSPNAQVALPPATLDDLRKGAFELFDECQWLRFLLLTKRPENIRRMWREPKGTFDAEFRLHGRANVWFGTSIANQADADRNIPLLLECRELAPVLFVSAEPLVGPVSFRWKPYHHEATGETYHQYLERVGSVDEYESLRKIDLVIVGGESGHGARPCRPEWIRLIVRQCRNAGVPCFVKQLGANVVTRNDMVEDQFNSLDSGWPDPDVEHNINGFRENYQGADCRIRLRDKKGSDMEEWPRDLRIREMPAPVSGGLLK